MGPRKHGTAGSWRFGSCDQTGVLALDQSGRAQDLSQQLGSGGASRDRQEGDVHLNQGQPVLPVLTTGTNRQMGLDVGRRLVGVFTAEQEVLDLFAIHGFSRSNWGASTSMSFCRALKTRQRAVSSVVCSTPSISRNDSPSSTRSRKAARKSGRSPPTARVSTCKFCRLITCSSGPCWGVGTVSGKNWRTRGAPH